MHWDDLETVAPEIARLGKERLDAVRVALLATLRADGSPRISPVEPYLHRGRLIFGSMTWSSKTRDLLRDPRSVLHSAVTGPDSGEGELKLYGRAIAAGDEVRDSCREAWWAARPREVATIFSLDIEQATFVSWNTEHGRMRIRRWSQHGGYDEAERSYP